MATIKIGDGPTLLDEIGHLRPLEFVPHDVQAAQELLRDLKKAEEDPKTATDLAEAFYKWSGLVAQKLEWEAEVLAYSKVAERMGLAKERKAMAERLRLYADDLRKEVGTFPPAVTPGGPTKPPPSYDDVGRAALEYFESPVGGAARPARVQMKRAAIKDTPDVALWMVIRRASLDLEYKNYDDFMSKVLCADPSKLASDEKKNRKRVVKDRICLPFPDVEPYRFLKAATEVFMTTHCGVWIPNQDVPPDPVRDVGPDPTTDDDDLKYYEGRLERGYTREEIKKTWLGYLQAEKGSTVHDELPYLHLIRNKLEGVALDAWEPGNKRKNQPLAACTAILRRKLTNPCLLELIWSYWHEEGMLVQTMNAITRRFQNIRSAGDRDPLASFEIDPLRPLNNFLWGYIQDEQHRLSVMRRAYEYDHHYGLKLVGRAVPGIKGADSRTQFVEAFHNLLHVSTIFFKEEDDTTVIADGFPVLNALRDVHILLSQGAHNQYGDLPWTARQEMYMQQWLLARPEMREFLPARTMVAYPEPWMEHVDAMKGLMGWADASVLHFRELAVFGERILLGARFNNWTEAFVPEQAANWARFWRPEIQGYVHAYRAVTGVDLSESAEATMPSTLLRDRLATQRVQAR